jgi:hypothetical protein
MKQEPDPSRQRRGIRSGTGQITVYGASGLWQRSTPLTGLWTGRDGIVGVRRNCCASVTARFCTRSAATKSPVSAGTQRRRNLAAVRGRWRKMASSNRWVDAGASDSVRKRIGGPSGDEESAKAAQTGARIPSLRDQPGDCWAATDFEVLVVVRIYRWPLVVQEVGDVVFGLDRLKLQGSLVEVEAVRKIVRMRVSVQSIRVDG